LKLLPIFLALAVYIHFMKRLNQVYQKIFRIHTLEIMRFTGPTILKELEIFAFNLDARKIINVIFNAFSQGFKFWIKTKR
jgi:hypothetical protein